MSVKSALEHRMGVERVLLRARASRKPYSEETMG
jgi:hypothetical protein